MLISLQIARLDTCVTVVDAKAFSGDVATCDSLLERYKDKVRGILSGQKLPLVYKMCLFKQNHFILCPRIEN